jgi:SynChlorMet cassette protein ScmD
VPISEKPVANPLVVLREEFDDYAVLFDPDSSRIYALNPVSVFQWKRFDGRHSIEDILAELRESCEDVPDDAEEHLREFVEELEELGLVGYELQKD